MYTYMYIWFLNNIYIYGPYITYIIHTSVTKAITFSPPFWHLKEEETCKVHQHDEVSCMRLPTQVISLIVSSLHLYGS